MTAFGEHLRQLRKEKGLTMKELAFDTDIEYSQISRIERGVINTTISSAYSIAFALKVPVAKLFEFDIKVSKKK